MTSTQRATAVRLGLFLLACFGVFLYLYHLSGGALIPGQKGYRVQAIVPDALGMAQNADVRQDGVRVGRVVDSRNLGRTTALMLELSDSHKPIYRDGTVLIRTKSVAGENYVELNPGHPQAGAIPDGGTLPLSHTEEATQIDDVLSVLSPARRRQLQRALTGLGAGLANHGSDLNQLFEATSAAVTDGGAVTATLAAQKQHLASLVDAVGRVTQALGDRRDAIRIFVRASNDAATAVAARDTELSRTLAELPGFLVQTRTTAGRLRGFSVTATPVVHDLRLALRDLTPAVEDLNAAAPAGERVTRELTPFARALRSPVAALGPFSRATANVVPGLATTLRQANPLLGYLSPFAVELPTVFGQIGAATKYTDTIGHLGRLAIMFGTESLPGKLSVGSSGTFGVNAYPGTGQAGESTPPAGPYPQLQPDPPYTSAHRRHG
jgi:phospholipid/cholesterol/gamma-HCH transport system substrate-binding protein